MLQSAVKKITGDKPYFKEYQKIKERKHSSPP